MRLLLLLRNVPLLYCSCTAHFPFLQWRIIFDEGHVLKNKATIQYRAALSLASERRWVVTGTPLDSEIEELHGLLQALQVCVLRGG